jgi:phosphatidylserine/phosphatidylglycerophosphate/cardiolipin synthase-like enzyme
MSFIKYIADERSAQRDACPSKNHYKEVLSLVGKAKRTVWIASLLKKGVEVRLIHAKEPGTAWREDHEKHPILYDGMERVLCPRVHFKLIIIDSTIAYVGSANLTGAGMGMKSLRKRRSALPLCSAKNFEAGILTDDPEMLDAAIEQFDNVWIGKFFASSSINAAKNVAVENIVQTQLSEVL